MVLCGAGPGVHRELQPPPWSHVLPPRALPSPLCRGACSLVLGPSGWALKLSRPPGDALNIHVVDQHGLSTQ